MRSVTGRASPPVIRTVLLADLVDERQAGHQQILKLFCLGNCLPGLFQLFEFLSAVLCAENITDHKSNDQIHIENPPLSACCGTLTLPLIPSRQEGDFFSSLFPCGRGSG